MKYKHRRGLLKLNQMSALKQSMISEQSYRLCVIEF